MKWFLICLCLVSEGWAVSEGVRLFWVDKDLGKIESADVDGGNRVVVKSGLDDPRGIAVDAEEGKIYWAVRNPTGAIFRANCDGSETELVIGALSDPGDIELDLENRLLYWAEEGTNQIRRAGMDGTSLETVLGGLNRPYYLAIDRGFVYWSDFNSPVIHRATVEGEGVMDLITGLGRVRDVEVRDGVIYWCDRDNSDVTSWLLSGVSAPVTLFAGGPFDRPHGLAIDLEEGTVFWTDTWTDRVSRRQIDRTGVVDVVASTSFIGPWAVAVARPVVAVAPYVGWAEENFTVAELAPGNEGTVWGEAADPDGDGRSNLLEYAQGTDPRGGVVREDLLRVTVEGEMVRVVVRMRWDDALLNFGLESTGDLGAALWGVGGFTEVGERVVDARDPDYEFITMEGERVVGSQFLRLRVWR